MKIHDEIRHGSYRHARVVTMEATYESFLDVLSSGPYAAARVKPDNRFARRAYAQLTETGSCGFGWRVLQIVDNDTQGDRT